MLVALDARCLQSSPPGGIARSLQNLLPLLIPDVDIVLLTDRKGEKIASTLPQHALTTPVPGISASWLQFSAPRWLRNFSGIFHCPFYGLPAWLPVSGVVTIHDLTFEHFPGWYSRRQTALFRFQARTAAKTAKAILTVSEFVKADIIHTYGVSPDRVLVAPHSVDPVFNPAIDPTSTLTKLGVRQPYVVALGGATRRNAPRAIAAWSIARSAGLDVSLVLVGGPAPPARVGLVHVPSPSDSTWAALLVGALAFLYPTDYEGFGLPALEAIGSGTPVVASRVASLPEVLGNNAAWSPSTSASDLAHTLLVLLSDQEALKALRLAGLIMAAGNQGWERGAQAHIEAYRRAAT